jgi:hypothetical protein
VAAEGVVKFDALEVKLASGARGGVKSAKSCGAPDVLGPTAVGFQKRAGELGADELAQAWLGQPRGRRGFRCYKQSHEEPFHGKPNVDFEL